jgi:hypothetical protein
VARAQSWEFEDRIIAAIEKGKVAHDLPPLSANSERTLFLLLQELRKELGFIGDSHLGWVDTPEKRQEAARRRVVKGRVGEADPVDRLTLQGIHNEQELHAAWDSKNNPETIDLIGRDATGKLLLGTFKDTVDVYYSAWSRSPYSHCEDFEKSIGIIKSLVIAECRAFWAGRLLAPSENLPAADKELPWFDRFPLADVNAELEDEADRWSKQAREEELRHRAEPTVEPVSSEPTATAPVIQETAQASVKSRRTRTEAEKKALGEIRNTEIQTRLEGAGFKTIGALGTRAAVPPATWHGFFNGERE